MIAAPHNDRTCLDAITREVAARVHDQDPALIDIVRDHENTEQLVEWIRSLPQRDDDGLPDDGPKVEVCRPVQRLRLPASDPNCVERAALYLGAAELLDPAPVRRLATVDTRQGLHTLPTEDDEPVVLDPKQTRNALRAGLFRARNGAATVIALTPKQAVDWIADLATEPAERFVDGPRRVDHGHRAVRFVLLGRPLAIGEIGDVAFMLALAAREAQLWGPAGSRVVTTTARAIDRLDQLAAENWQQRTAPRNLSAKQILTSLARIGGRVGGKVGIEAVKLKLASVGITPPVLNAVEKELQREGMSLGPLATPPPMLGSLAALTPQALAGRWLAQKLSL